MTPSSAQRVLYFGQGKAENLPESILKLYTRLMEKMRVDTMTNKEQSIIMLELSQTIRNRMKQKYPSVTLSGSDSLATYSRVCTEVLTELLSKIYS